MVKVTIDDIEVSVEEGTLILDAAKKAGIHIPTFCYHADLAGIGSCRMCIVEIEGQKKLQPSCVVPVMDGMNIRTNTDKVQSAREAMLEFLLSNHALDCPVCDKGGECSLQNMVYEHGPRKGRFGETKHRWHDRDYVLSPVIVKNSNRCVQCTRCVRVCADVVGRAVLGVIGRGHVQEETSFLRSPLDCDHDGNCIEVCPVGCFMRLPYRYKARPWDLKSAYTVCPYCGTGCRTTIQERDGEVLRSIASIGVGINSVLLCARGRFGYDIVNSTERLKDPLVRKNGKLEPVSWQEALEAVKEGLSTGDGSKVAGIASARLTNEELYLFQKFFRDLLKSPNIDSTSRWTPSAASAFIGAAGLHSGAVSIEDCIGADVLFIIGSQVSEENPVVDYLIRRKAGSSHLKIVIASPRAMKLDSSAYMTLRHLPAAEGPLLEALAALVEKKDGAEVEGLISAAGLTKQEVEALSRDFMTASTVAVMAGVDFLRFPENIPGLRLFADKLRGLKKTVHIMPLLDRCNQRGAWDMGVHPGFGPGYEKSAGTGLGSWDVIERASKGDIDALYVAGEDIVSLFPDRGLVEKGLGNLKCLIVQTSFLDETAKMAHIVLPSATFAEKSGTYTNQEGRVQRIFALNEPPGGAKTDLEIFSAVGSLFDSSFGADDAGEVFDEIRERVGSYSNVEFEHERSGPLVSASKASLNGEAPSGRREYEKGEGFMLITGNHLLHSGRLSARSDILRSLLDEAVIEISAEDAERLELKEGDTVKVKGADFEAELKLRTKAGTRSGVAFIAENFGDVPVNRFLRLGNLIPRVSISRA